MKEKARGISLYVHFPFCIKRCNYCDFASYVLDGEVKKRYLSTLKSEISLLCEKFFIEKVRVNTLYFGGGTPSLLNAEEMHSLIEHLKRYFIFPDSYEFTIEANPETVEYSKFKDYREIGVNRVSIGAQSFNEETLSLLGRIHTSKRIYEAFETLRIAGFKNINLDLMFGLPHEKIEDTLFSLKEALKLYPEHISYYSLMIERGTPLYAARKKYSFPSEEDSFKEYKYGISTLEGQGYKQYEISNFARDGFQCMHNIAYWRSSPYIGFGLSAGSFLKRVRWKNVLQIDKYFSRVANGELPWSFREKLKGRKEKGEFIIMGLRMNEGFLVADFYERFGVLPEMDFGGELLYLKEKKLIKIDNSSIRLTRKGLYLANQVMQLFI